MNGSIVTLLTKPYDFFKNLNSNPQSLEIPALFVLMEGLIAAVGAYMLAGLTGKMMSGIMPGMESITGIIAVVGAVIGAFVFWVVIAGVFFIVSSLFKGSGSFGRCLEVTGWGFLPQVFSSLIITVITIVTVPSVSIPAISKSALSDPQAVQAAVTALMQDPSMMMIRQVTAVVSIIFILWSGHIWSEGMKEARGLSLRDARLCVGIPIVLYVIYLIYSVTLA